MPSTTFAAQYAQAVQRARTIAAIARDRFAGQDTMAVLDRIARHLDDAAQFLDAHEAGPVIDLPIEACEALWEADTLAEQHPQARFPVDFTNYVLAPLSGRPLPFPEPLNPVTDEFAVRETDLTNRLRQLHDDGELMTEQPDEWLRTVLTVWRDWMRLSGEVRVVDHAGTRKQG